MSAQQSPLPENPTICQQKSELSQTETENGISRPANRDFYRENALSNPAFVGQIFKPGQSGNPSGRPKKRPISDLYDEILSDPENVKLFKASVIKAVSSGRMASMFQLKEMADRVEGKVTQPVEMSGEVTLAVSDRVSRARERAKLVGNSDSEPNVTK